MIYGYYFEIRLKNILGNKISIKNKDVYGYLLVCKL